MCHKGNFRTVSKGKIWDIDITRGKSNVVNEVYKSVYIIYVDHDIGIGLFVLFLHAYFI